MEACLISREKYVFSGKLCRDALKRSACNYFHVHCKRNIPSVIIFKLILESPCTLDWNKLCLMLWTLV